MRFFEKKMSKFAFFNFVSLVLVDLLSKHIYYAADLGNNISA